MSVIFSLFSIVLPIALFGGLIWLLVWSIKRAKRKSSELKVKMEKIKEETKVAQEVKIEALSQDEQINTSVSKLGGENQGTKFLITIFIIVISPLRLFLDPMFLAISNMDTATIISKAFGFKIRTCKYCKHYYSSINWACKDSPNGKHHG